MIRVRVKRTYPNLEGYFDLGEEMYICSILRMKDEVIHDDIYASRDEGHIVGVFPRVGSKRDKEAFNRAVATGEFFVSMPKVVRKHGTVERFYFLKDDGTTIHGDALVHHVGPRLGAFGNIFEKLEVN